MLRGQVWAKSPTELAAQPVLHPRPLPPPALSWAASTLSGRLWVSPAVAVGNWPDPPLHSTPTPCLAA